MPWNAKEFAAKHNHKLSPKQAATAAKTANAVLKQSGDEGKAVRIGNYVAKRTK